MADETLDAVVRGANEMRSRLIMLTAAAEEVVAEQESRGQSQATIHLGMMAHNARLLLRDPELVTCDYCGDPISESDQDLMIDGMHEGCYEEWEEDQDG